MPIPAVTCDAKISAAWASGGGFLTAARDGRGHQFSHVLGMDDPLGASWAHTFAAAGTYTVKIRIKYTGGYGPSTLWNGALTVIRFR